MFTLWDFIDVLSKVAANCETFAGAMCKKAAKKCKPTSLKNHNSHKHKCEECGFVWRHHNNNAGNKATHTCPCGNEVWKRYHGDKRAGYVGCCSPQRKRKAN